MKAPFGALFFCFTVKLAPANAGIHEESFSASHLPGMHIFGEISVLDRVILSYLHQTIFCHY
jgi:hypothetical protein